MNSPSVFVTGAASGIGRATALLFARRGYRVAAVDVDAAGLEVLAAEQPGIVTGVLDVTDAPGWERALKGFCTDGTLDLLVNNAGLLASGPFETTALARHRQMVDVNVTGTITGCHSAFEYLRRTPGAQVVNLCSASALYGQPELATYSATKFAVRGLTEALDLEWAPHGVRVIALWPLFVETAMTRDLNVGAARRLGIRLTADDVARDLYDLTRPGRRPSGVHHAVGWQAKAFAALAQVTPTRLNRLVNRWVTGS
ncbi:SDR family oxidoreductase [Rhodococcus aetherivorans]|uniref:SDR family oxidoreductase n=1 Tax=Rhodococcus aetherivorans TaxID=191292 RepID=A0AA46SFB2_9NOCA|nr:SDR family oxidoreductase [Rhodococcus aetherivorans]KDE12187.1 short-chain dehydrogenase [Rhodococcus aetherivorans]NCL73037.1 3-phenylpropionate-dihydrodiol/cinnamic acid-dihydrodiol dehydrogenase [Rhodococcus sp. YH1]UYF95706.1 SDR family oxidoreductase [Rhodococcus aetherivorans]WFS15664.1 SDR family oxidoreductase [Rhodococcus aetherivorans]